MARSMADAAQPEIDAVRYRRAMIAAYQAELQRAASGDGAFADARAGDYDDFRLSPHAYPGLRSFNPREGGVFFGREPNIKDIQQRLARQRVVVVLGGSGSGKSSVIRAGLMPRLNSTLPIEGRSGNWYAVEFRPRQQPMDELVGALAELVGKKFSEQGPAIPEAGRNDAASPPSPPDHAAVLARLREQFQLGGEVAVSSEQAERKRRAYKLSKALFDFVDKELDRRDRLATRGLRSGHPSLLVVIDQFEEIFRPEVPTNRVGGRQDMLDLVIAVYARLQARRVESSAEDSGLFLAITMRSEELHRCTEHPGLDVSRKGRREQRSLADLVNSSGYLLDLLDPIQDRQQLTDAIVRPARGVFEDWGLPLDPSSDHAPFDRGVVDWLLEGAALLSGQLEHRADQLPLLQHGLQTIWHRAMEEWSGNETAPLVIRRQHLQRESAADGKKRPEADLIGCLDNRADEAFERAIGRFIAAARNTRAAAHDHASDATHKDAGEAAIRAAFRALARRDDRGNWARRFAEPERVLAFVDADREAAIGRIAGDSLEFVSIAEALREFIASGYLTGGQGRAYDISHEALIRNWRRFQIWLLEPDEAAQALVQAINFLDVKRPTDAISSALARSLGTVVGGRATLPESWAKEQILPLLARQDLKRKWSKLDPNYGRDADKLAEVILRNVELACELAERERYRSARDSYWSERYKKQRQIFVYLQIAVPAAAVAGWEVLRQWPPAAALVSKLLLGGST